MAQTALSKISAGVLMGNGRVQPSNFDGSPFRNNAIASIDGNLKHRHAAE